MITDPNYTLYIILLCQVHCADITRGGLLPDSRCSHLSRPRSEDFCDAGPCVADVWLVGQWGPVTQ